MSQTKLKAKQRERLKKEIMQRNLPVASQKITLIKFLLRILGALTAAPTKLAPVSQIPQAAPTTESPKPKAIPKLAYPYGDLFGCLGGGRGMGCVEVSGVCNIKCWC